MRTSGALLLSVLLSLEAQAQGYVPITTDNSRWLFHVISQFGVESLEGLDFGQDTLINGEVYKKVNWGYPAGAMRDDGGKVWYYPHEPSSFLQVDSLPVLLYDFELQVGDSFRIPSDSLTWAHVISRDSVILNDGSYRGRLHFAPVNTQNWSYFSGTWIEGIGDPDFVLGMLWEIWEVGVWLECYGINNVPLYGSCLYLGQEDHEVDLGLRLMPLGTYGKYILEGSMNNATDVSIFDPTGRTLNTAYRNGMNIDLSTSPPGVYLVRVSSQDGDGTIRVCLTQP